MARPGGAIDAESSQGGVRLNGLLTAYANHDAAAIHDAIVEVSLASSTWSFAAYRLLAEARRLGYEITVPATYDFA